MTFNPIRSKKIFITTLSLEWLRCYEESDVMNIHMLNHDSNDSIVLKIMINVSKTKMNHLLGLSKH